MLVYNRSPVVAKVVKTFGEPQPLAEALAEFRYPEVKTGKSAHPTQIRTLRCCRFFVTQSLVCWGLAV